MSSKFPFDKKGFKHYFDYKYAKKVRPLYLTLRKMSAYRRDFDKTKYLSFLIRNDKLLEENNKIWENLSNSMKKMFDSEPVCNEKYIKIKIKFYEGKINTGFHGDKVPKEGS